MHRESSSEPHHAQESSSYPRRASFLFTGLEYRYSWRPDLEAALIRQGLRRGGGTAFIASEDAVIEWPTRWENWTPNPQSLSQEAPCEWITCAGLNPQVVHLIAMQPIPEAQIDSEQLNWGDDVSSDSDVEDEIQHWPAEENETHGDGDINTENILNEELVELEQQMENVGTRLSREIIMENIVCKKFSSPEDVKECCICLEEYNKEDERLGILECMHEFHLECIVEWLQMKNTCPICRKTGFPVSDTNL